MSSIKQSIKSIIEFLHLGKLVDKLRFYQQYLSNYSTISAFLKQHKSEAFPTPYMIYETFRLDYERYWKSGREDAEWVINLVTPFQYLTGKRILDWGCGPARVIRHFPKLLNATFYGTDYNDKYVDWCKNNISGIDFRKNHLNPPLAFEINSLDFIYSISIFTHLSKESHFQWIDEMYRVLDKDGIFFFTSHGDITVRNLLAHEKEQYENGDIVVRGSVKEGYRMYCAYHPIPFIQKLLKNKFEVLLHIPGEEKDWGLEQDVWIVRKLSII